jgi:hypothetical protein
LRATDRPPRAASTAVIPDAHRAGDPESVLTPLKLKMNPGLRQDGGYCGGRFGAALLAMTVLVVLLMVFNFLRVKL